MSEEFMTATEVAQFHAEGLRMRTEAEVLRKRAAEDRAAAEYERGQAEHRLRTVEATEAGISKREAALKAAGEPEFLARLAEADAKLKQAEDLMAYCRAQKIGAMTALQQINEREKRAEAAARETPAAA